MILSRENQDLRHNLSIAEKQLKILTRDVERLTAENRKRKTELYQSKAKETLMLAKKKGKWKKQQKPRRKSFDSLTNYLAQITQTDEAIVQYLSGQEDSKHFFMDIIKALDRKVMHKSLFTPLEAFCIYHSSGLTRKMYSELKRWYKILGMLDPFPYLEQLKKVEGSVDSKELLTVQEKCGWSERRKARHSCATEQCR
ncbi:hypothetical protein B9Z55_001648 [Caenorhabditis nigoni]|uniref:Uncharacterized protein n=1 Tax=Caenorhabditis nigoni TaxID=1611254 RepID=A0A2G5VGQ5_9PELO|nr:hypothetical protein B9Z55_001648 [Caenorhabditis nigoni]